MNPPAIPGLDPKITPLKALNSAQFSLDDSIIVMRATIRSLLIVSMLLFAGCNVVGIPLSGPQATGLQPVIDPSEHCSAIRQRLLAITPPGTRAPQVAAFIAREMRAHGETSQWVTKLRNGGGLIRRPSCEGRGSRDVRVGSKNIRASFESPSLSFMLGLPVSTKNVAQVCYAFNDEDRLLDIGVSTCTTGLF